MASIINSTTTAGVTVTGDNSGSLQLATNNGTTAVTIDTSQNVGIGTSSPSYKLHVRGADATATLVVGNTSEGTQLEVLTYQDDKIVLRSNDTSNVARALAFETGITERMRITSGGNLCLNTTSTINNAAFINIKANPSTNWCIATQALVTNSYNAAVFFNVAGTDVGTIVPSASSTAYNTSSDYRLKENIAPMTGALATVAQLKPCTFKWKATGESTQGFIAHELQAVVPDCVTGEKDAVDAEGNPVHQGIDTSFLVATLAAAIQELKAELDATKAEVQALKGTL